MHLLMILVLSCAMLPGCRKPAAPARKPPDLDGYKGAKWGMSPREVQAALSSRLILVSEQGIHRGPIDYFFLIRWGATRRLTGTPILRAMPRGFKVYRTNDGDSAVFFRNRLYAFMVQIEADQFVTARNRLIADYGRAYGTPRGRYREPYSYHHYTWDAGRTTIKLIGCAMKDARWESFRFKVFYISDEIERAVKQAAIRNADRLERAS